MLDEMDKKILRLIQRNNALPLEEIAKHVGSSKSPVWARIKKLKEQGYIQREVAMLDPDKMGLGETFFVTIKANSHSKQWLEDFASVVEDMPQIMEAYRMAGDIDYLLKVRVQSTSAFDAFYKELISRIDLKDVSSLLSMERMKETHLLDF